VYPVKIHRDLGYHLRLRFFNSGFCYKRGETIADALKAAAPLRKLLRFNVRRICSPISVLLMRSPDPTRLSMAVAWG